LWIASSSGRVLSSAGAQRGQWEPPLGPLYSVTHGTGIGRVTGDTYRYNEVRQPDPWGRNKLNDQAFFLSNFHTTIVGPGQGNHYSFRRVQIEVDNAVGERVVDSQGISWSICR
jgi:hypothetical protein